MVNFLEETCSYFCSRDGKETEFTLKDAFSGLLDCKKGETVVCLSYEETLLIIFRHHCSLVNYLFQCLMCELGLI